MYISNWQAVSERIMMVEIQICKHEVMTIISAYGPNEDEKAETKDEFWRELNTTTDNGRRVVYVMGDLNGRLGKRDAIYTSVRRLR